MKVDIKKCPRCGERHDDLEYHEFIKDSVVEEDGKSWFHWATRPSLGEPILLRVETIIDVEEA